MAVAPSAGSSSPKSSLARSLRSSTSSFFSAPETTSSCTSHRHHCKYSNFVFSCFFLYAILCNSSSCSGCSTFSSGDSLWTLSISILGGGGGGGGRGGVLPAQNSTQNDTISILRRTSWILFERRYPVLLEEGLTVGFIKKPRCERRESKLRCDLDT